jgi:hypothetical protein
LPFHYKTFVLTRREALIAWGKFPHPIRVRLLGPKDAPPPRGQEPQRPFAISVQRDARPRADNGCIRAHVVAQRPAWPVVARESCRAYAARPGGDGAAGADGGSVPSFLVASAAVRQPSPFLLMGRGTVGSLGSTL